MKRNEVYILGAWRTPFGKFMGALKDIPAPQMAAQLLAAVSQNKNIFPDLEKIDGVFMGQVLTAGAGQNPARQVILRVGFSHSCHREALLKISAETFNKVCASSLAALHHAANAIRLGEANLMVAGGMENMSRAPYLLPRSVKSVGDQKLSEFLAGNADAAKTILRDGILFDGLRDIYAADMPHMGEFADICSRVKGISRADQEAYSAESHIRALQARKDGNFAEYHVLIPAAPRLTFDEGVREPDLAKMKSLSPAFKQFGTVTAATSSQISDGAAVLLLSSAAAAKKCGMRPMAKILGFATHSQRPIWYTTAPVGAIKKVLEKANLLVEDVDLFEINEAFAVVPLYAMRELNIPHDKVNIWGGAIAIGHPIGASGARIAGTLVHQLVQARKRYGIAVACNGGGEAVAVLVENLRVQ